MRLFKPFLLAMISVFAVSSIQAASFVPSVGKADSSLIELVKGKKKKGKKKAKASKAGKCGEFKYWSKKKHKCEDARKKK